LEIKTIVNRLFPGDEKAKIYSLSALIILSGLLEAFGLISIAPFLGIAADPSLIDRSVILNFLYIELDFRDKNFFILLLGFVFLNIVIISSLFRVFLNKKINTFVQFSTARLSQVTLRNYLSFPYSFFLDQHSSEISKNILNEVARAVETVIYPFLHAAAKLVVTFFLVFVLFLADPLIAVTISLSFFSFYLFVFKFIRKKLESIGKSASASISDRYKIISETLSGIKEIKLRRMESQSCEIFKGPSENYAKHIVTSHFLGDVPKAVIEITTFTAIVLMIIYLIVVEDNSGDRVTMLTLYGFAAYRIMPAIQLVFANATQIKFNFSALNELACRLNSNDLNRLISFEDTSMPFPDQIDLDIASYNYPSASESVLSNIKINLRKGNKIGIVGESGSGKSTLIDIILGLLETDKGEIRLGNEKLCTENLLAWQKNLSYVPQDIFLFDGSIEQNIAFSLNSETIDSNKIDEVVEIAELHEYISSLPQKAKTMVGERGVRISGGQKQRIGIARALYKEAEFLIMDEATSALDSINEKKIFANINKISAKLSILIVAHRLSTVKDCDHIYVLNKGRIVAEGNYLELFNNSNHFRNLAS